MRVGLPSQRDVASYGLAVAAVPLSLGTLTAPNVVPTLVEPTQVRSVRSMASSEIGKLLDSRWSSYNSELAINLEKVTGAAIAPVDSFAWFEMPDDVAYPVSTISEVLTVEIVEGSQADPFRFTDTGFDAWV